MELGRGTATYAERESMVSEQILVVDDQSDVPAYLSDFLSQSGYRVLARRDAAAALGITYDQLRHYYGKFALKARGHTRGRTCLPKERKAGSDRDEG